MEKMPTTMKRPRLLAVEALDDYKLRLHFINGSIYTVSMAEELEKTARLRLLKDPNIFKKATIIEGEGWAVEWQDLDIQFCADILWLDVQAQNAPDENSRFFAQWRATHGFSMTDAARALGIRPQTISAYEKGKRPMPRYIALACKGWEVENQK
jgi:DNA-binding XRE family transcriptional regulator